MLCYMNSEATVGVRELRQNLSVYLRRVAEGDVFRVTDNGRPVAVLGPLPERMTALDRLIADGRLIPAKRGLRDLGTPLPPASDGPSLSELIEEDREERLDPT